VDLHFSFNNVTGYFTLADIDKDDYRRYVEVSRLVAQKVGFAPGASGVIINGRVRLALSLPVPKCEIAAFADRWPVPIRRIHARGLPNTPGL